jgi:hypothetical protein
MRVMVNATWPAFATHLSKFELRGLGTQKYLDNINLQNSGQGDKIFNARKIYNDFGIFRINRRCIYKLAGV